MIKWIGIAGLSLVLTGSISPIDTQLSRAEVLHLYQSLYHPEMSRFEWNGSKENCDPGTLTREQKQLVVDRINFFRKVNGLVPVVENTQSSPRAQAAALMMSTNGELSHSPTEDWTCYSEEGARGASTSNLGILDFHSFPEMPYVVSFMRDYGQSNYSCGHRRWLLFTRLGKVGIGITSMAHALSVGEGTGVKGHVDDMPEFIAYPWKGFVPDALVFRKWSFALPTGRRVDFSQARVEVRNETGKMLHVKMFPFRRLLDPCITWEVPDLFPGSEYISGGKSLKDIDGVGKVFHVRIRSVKVDGVLKEYRYSIQLIEV